MSKFKKEDSAVYKREETTTSDITALPIMAIPERGLSKDTCEHYGVRTEYSEVKGIPVAHYFPVTKKGKITGYIKRDLIKPKKTAWSTVGDVAIENEMLGQSACADGGRKVFITEGFYDVLSVYQALYEGWGQANNVKPNVVSIPLGAGNAAESIANNLEFVGKFQTPVVVFDSDEDGRDAVGAVSVLLGEMHNVELPTKDPNELLLEDQDKLNKLCAFSKAYEPDCLSFGGGSSDDVMTPLKRGIMLPSFPKLMGMMHGIRERELTVILSQPKAGKSTFCKEIMYQLLKSGEKCVGMFLEEDINKTRQSFVARDNEVHLPTFRENPSILTKEQVDNTLKGVLSPDKAMFATADKGGLTPDRIIQTFRHCHSRGAMYGILDHASLIMSAMNSKNERQDLDNFMTELVMFVRESGMHIFVVAHIKRKDNYSPKNKDGTVRYPYWNVVESTDGRSSGAFEQLAFNMVGIDKEVREDKQLVHTRLTCLLNREWGITGDADVMTLDNHTGMMRCVDNYGFEDNY